MQNCERAEGKDGQPSRSENLEVAVACAEWFNGGQPHQQQRSEDRSAQPARRQPALQNRIKQGSRQTGKQPGEDDEADRAVERDFADRFIGLGQASLFPAVTSQRAGA